MIFDVESYVCMFVVLYVVKLDMLRMLAASVCLRAHNTGSSGFVSWKTFVYDLHGQLQSRTSCGLLRTTDLS